MANWTSFTFTLLSNPFMTPHQKVAVLVVVLGQTEWFSAGLQFYHCNMTEVEFDAAYAGLVADGWVECRGVDNYANSPKLDRLIRSGRNWLYMKPKDRKWYGSDWPWQRFLALERDDNKCRDCGTGESLHVHHMKQIVNGGTNDPDNLITLCKDCHERADEMAAEGMPWEPTWEHEKERRRLLAEQEAILAEQRRAAEEKRRIQREKAAATRQAKKAAVSS